MGQPYGITGTPTYSFSIDDVGTMLVRLPDNTGNQISARDVRDVVTGLWDKINIVSASAGSSASVFYTNINRSSVAVGGLATQSTFNNVSIQTLLTRMLYPYTPPILSLGVSTVNGSIKEFGSSISTGLNYTITATINRVTGAQLYAASLSRPRSVTPPASPFSTMSGNVTLNAVQNVTSTFTLVVDDRDYTTNPITGATHAFPLIIGWRLKRFWGTLPSSSPLVTVSTANFAYSAVSTLFSDLLQGYGQSRDITTNNDYVVFIWPNNPSVNLQALPPVVTVNGIPNNDWIKTRNGVTFTNQFGYTASYDVWCFNATQPNYTLRYVLS
jgi:hypothetical protein